jgi:hypothetical protein
MNSGSISTLLDGTAPPSTAERREPEAASRQGLRSSRCERLGLSLQFSVYLG